jgi:predicted RNA-binding protein associated with RNAse of E/G family
LLWDEDWQPLHWYVNLQAPLRRTRVGFDLVDHILDVIVSIDRSAVRWKDEDELQQAIALGMFTAEEADRFRSQGERAVARLVGREPPFHRDWTDWRPDPSWTPAELPAGWDRL